MDAVETMSVGRREFDQLRSRLPLVDRFLVEVLARQVRAMSALLLEALYVDAESRVLRRLLALADEYGGPEANTPVVVPYTQDDVATMAGTTRPTVNRVLRAAQESGAVELGRGRVTVTDRPPRW